MQGRLLPKYESRYQAHPVGYWQEEFLLASQYKLDLIEFILDYNDFDANPIRTSSGIDEIKSVSLDTGVYVKSICADYFMEAPLHSSDDNIVEKSIQVLLELINSASKLKISDIVLPCVDQSSISEE